MYLSSTSFRENKIGRSGILKFELMRISAFFVFFCNIFPFNLLNRQEGGEDLEKDLLEKLYKRYYKELYIYIYSICKRKSMTEDILHEAFFKAFISLKDSHTNMRAWLYMVSRNLCFNQLREEKKLETEEVLIRSRKEETDEILEQYLLNEKKQKVWEAIDLLEGMKKEVIVLQYFADMGQREIAAMLHLTPENVRMLAYRARKELRNYLEKSDL